MSENRIFNVTEAEFEAAVVARSHQVPVVVDFWAPWCGPCQALGPLLERLVEGRGGDVVLAKVNLDEAPNLARRYRVESIPTVIAFKAGTPVLDFVGALPEPHLAKFLDRLVPSADERRAQEAAALEATNPQQAEKLYRQVLQGSPHPPAAAVGLARLLLARGADGEAAELLENVAAGGELGNEVERLTAVLWLRRQAQDLGDEAALRDRLAIDPENAQLLYELGCVLAGQGRSEEALELLYRAAERDRKLAAARVRETMVKVFHVVGVRSPLADDYRDKLTAVLY